MEEVLRELVEAQKEANRINGAILALWEKSEVRQVLNDERGYAHYLASSLCSIKYLREEYLALADALYKEPDNEVIQESIDDIIHSYKNISLEISPGCPQSWPILTPEIVLFISGISLRVSHLIRKSSQRRIFLNRSDTSYW